jgi:hypothetical protein
MQNDNSSVETEENKFMLEFQTMKKDKTGSNKHIWNCKNQLDVKDFLEQTSYTFTDGGWIQKNDTNAPGFDICVTEEFQGVSNVIYMISIFGKILKGGKSKNPLPQRSYAAGTEKTWIEGDPSKTNYVWSQIFRACIEKNIPVKFYIYAVKTIKVSYPLSNGGGENQGYLSHYEEIEKSLNAHLKSEMKKKGGKPIGEGKLLALYKA